MTAVAAGWAGQFGEDYDVPAEITSALPDVSWHNDACPAFGRSEHDTDIVLWAEHPDPARRELDGPRFTVTSATGEQVLASTDDAGEALRAYREAAR